MPGTVVAEYLTPLDAPARGTVTFRTNTADGQLRDPGGNVVVAGPIKVRLVAGELNVDLPATDDPAFAETGWQWCADVAIAGAPRALRWFELEDGDTVNLADIAGELAPGDPLTHPASLSDLNTGPGTEADFVDRVSPFTTTETNLAGPDLIDGMAIDILGNGRPVDVEFYAPAVWHSVADTVVTIQLVVENAVLDSNAQIGGASSPSTTTGPGAIIKRRLVVPDGVTWTVEVGVASNGAGTATLSAAGFAPIMLGAVRR